MSDGHMEKFASLQSVQVNDLLHVRISDNKYGLFLHTNFVHYLQTQKNKAFVIYCRFAIIVSKDGFMLS